MDALFHSDSAYVTVALFACGNAIAILAGLVLQWVWSVLSTFRDQFLWALLCSWALRDLKDGIVRRLDWSLRERSLPHFMLSLALLPFQAFGLGLTLTGASMPRCAREDSTGSTVGGVKSEWDSPQHTSSSSSQCLEPKSQRVDEGSSSSMLMGWLVRVTVAYSLMSWMREFWSWNWAGRTLPIGVILASIIVLVCLVYWVPICWKRAAWRLNPTTDVGASATHPTLKRSQVLQFVSGTLRQVTKGVHKVDAFVRSRLRLLLDGLVSIGLIACLLMGSVLLAAFVSVQIVHESKLAVAQVNQMVLRSSNKTDLEGVWSTVRVYQDSVLGMVQEFLPDVTQTIGSRVDSFLQAHNLTQVAVYAKLVYGLTVATPCEGDEMHNLAADVAAANAGLRALQEAQSQLMQQVESRQGEFLAAATRWEALKAGGQFRIFPGLHDYALSMAGNELVESRQRLMEANQKLADAHKAREMAASTLETAELQYSMCVRQPNGTLLLEEGPGHVVGRRLQSIYDQATTLQWWGMATESQLLWSEIVVLVGNWTAAGDDSNDALSAAQNMVQSAAQPLLVLGQSIAKAAATSIGATTGFAVAGGAGMIRVGIAFVTFGIRFVLFATLLWLLLTAEKDPIYHVVQLLPVSESSRQRAKDAVQKAVRAVLLSSMKLAAFHALFTWVTFRIFGVHFAYLSAVASGVMATLQLVPVFVVAFPAGFQILLQGEGLKAATLCLLHFVAYNYAYESILNDIPDSLPYLTGLGIVGGIYTFDNPFQGALLGPMLLTLLSVAYNLHCEFLAPGLNPQHSWPPFVPLPAYSTASATPAAKSTRSPAAESTASSNDNL